MNYSRIFGEFFEEIIPKSQIIKENRLKMNSPTIKATIKCMKINIILHHISAVDISPVVKQELSHLMMPLVRSHVERRTIDLSSSISRDSSSEQYFGSFCMIVLSGEMKRARTELEKTKQLTISEPFGYISTAFLHIEGRNSRRASRFGRRFKILK